MSFTLNSFFSLCWLSYSLLAVLKYTVDDPLPSPCWFVNSRSCAPIRLLVPVTSLCPSCLWVGSAGPCSPPTLGLHEISQLLLEWEHALFLCLAHLLNVMYSSSIHAAADDRALCCVVEYCFCVCSGHVPFIPCWWGLGWFQTLADVDDAALKLGAVTDFYTWGTWATSLFSSSLSPKPSVECCIPLCPWIPLGWTTGKGLWVNSWVSVFNWYLAALTKRGSQWPWTRPHIRSKDVVRFLF